MDDRTRWNERYRAGEGPTRINPRLYKYLHLLKRGRALDLAGGIGQNAALLKAWDVILVDISEQALARASGNRVQADALALPFPPNAFDTIICTYFFEPRMNFCDLLTPGGTLFFETYTFADAKYRPEFNPAHRFNPTETSLTFKGLEILHFEETDDGARVFGTLIALKPPE
jgi:tellurite methyltransferase